MKKELSPESRAHQQFEIANTTALFEGHFSKNELSPESGAKAHVKNADTPMYFACAIFKWVLVRSCRALWFAVSGNTTALLSKGHELRPSLE